MNDLINNEQISHFLYDVENHFPNFAAAVISDSNGLPIGSRIPTGFKYQEQILALEAVAKNRSFIDTSKFIKVKVSLNEDKSVRLLLLLKKPKTYLKRFKNIKKISKLQMIF
ncbi:MAG: hypothetical protein ACQERB_02855 [Promethearchaeati archaeon]